MKIVHFILGRASQNTANGVNKVIGGLAKYGNQKGHKIYVVGISASQKESFTLVSRDGFEVESYNTFFNGAFKRVKELLSECDVVHLHSVWNNYNLFLANYLRKVGKPYVVTAHSGLTEDRLKQSNYKFKLAYHALFQKKLFDSAAGVHALTREESTVLRKHTDNNNIFVVSNGQDLGEQVLSPKKYDSVNEKINIGFIGRLSVEKNIDGLINAIALLPPEIRSRIILNLIGPNALNKKQLDKEIKRMGIESNIVFKGALYGADKDRALSNLDFYIHPAHSDVVSIAVMEAMRLGLPSVITRTSDVSYFYNRDAFVMIEPDSKDIARGIVEMFERRAEWSNMSMNAIALVHDVFNWEKVVEQLIIQYKGAIDIKCS
ncbi:hypothetical protein CJF42_12095 [Pseudoalteromonas sp. NBT06-2]|uniref:glycosyltransferase n=1 Tax=Pseudoalteromonas sp. NBT06-2 TaxID=2025950 RepID=UPI000BA5DD3A|nr:glycosyltransferase [Pseudoalteromonas sp. NBT06-2]PAJ74135.1 hypothetical protein CJF42_12095 [Pseudoalteromonas sp. NBT06-2]